MARTRHTAMRDHMGRRRETTWARAQELVVLAANGNYSNIDLLGPWKTAGGAQQGVTVTRMHVTLSVVTAVAANDTFAWGIMRGQDSDLGANIAGAPTPISHPYEDWMWWRTEVASTNGEYFPAFSNVMEFDIKAQRRLPELDMVLELVVLRSSVAAASLTVSAVVSTLLKLP